MEELVIKKDFSDIYTKEYPAPYLEEMKNVEYRIPDQTRPLYKHLTERMGNYLRRTINILDLGSSYGINSALLNHELIMSELEDFFVQQNPKPSNKEVQDFFDELPNKNPNLQFYLVDTSSQALEFAEKSGLCEKSFCVNMEKESLSSEFKLTLSNIDLIISTGCVGYIGWKSFKKLFKNINEQIAAPIFAFSVLRIFHMDKIEKIFRKNSFELIKTKIGPLRQRRFYNDEEMKKTLDLLDSRNMNTHGLEDTGYYFADFYVAGHSHAKLTWLPWMQNLEDVFIPIQGVQS